MPDLANRLDELEIRYAHQSRLVDELNEVLVESNERIARLEDEVRFLRRALDRMIAGPQGGE